MRSRLRAFLQGLREAGYVEGRNVAIEYRWAEGHYDRLPALAADLVRRQVAVIVAPGGYPGGTRRQGSDLDDSDRLHGGATRSKLGLVASLNRPGGNVTGVTSWLEVAPKRLELLHELRSHGDLVAVLVNPTIPTGRDPDARRAGGRTRTRAAAPCPGGEHRTRVRRGLRDLVRNAGRRRS